MPIRSRRDWTAGAKRAPQQSRQIIPTAANAFDAEGKARMRRAKFISAVRQADEPVTGLVAVPRRTIVLIIMESRNSESRNSPELLGPDELLFFVSHQ
jgi:hypothetical protein